MAPRRHAIRHQRRPPELPRSARRDKADTGTASTTPFGESRFHKGWEIARALEEYAKSSPGGLQEFGESTVPLAQVSCKEEMEVFFRPAGDGESEMAKRRYCS